MSDRRPRPDGSRQSRWAASKDVATVTEPDDDDPIPPGLIGVIDETTPADRHGLYYVVSCGVIVTDAVTDARQALRSTIGQRQRLFHWHTEGIEARRRMLACIGDLGVVAQAGVHYPTGRRGQERARRIILSDLIVELIYEGVGHVLIETRSAAQDGRDRATILDTFAKLGRPHAFTYEWRTKAEPLLWIADAINGAIKEHLLAEDDRWLEHLRRSGVIDELTYHRPSPNA